MRFEDVLEIKNGRNQKAVENPNGKYPIYGSGGVMGYADDYICEGQTVVIGRKGSINNPIFVEEPFWNVDTAFGLIADKSVLLPRYLYYFCRKFNFESLNKTVTIPSLTKSDLLKIEIELPCLEKQQAVSNTLQQIEQVISLRKKELQKLDELVKARFVEMFGAVNADACKRTIKEYAYVLGGYAFKSDEFIQNQIPVIRISNINDGVITPDHSVCYSKDFWDNNAKYRAIKGDILMAMSGATTGKAGICLSEMPLLVNQRVACIRAKDGVSCPEFLYAATQMGWMYDLIQEKSAGCAQPNISGKQIENMPIPDAPIEKQKEYAAFVKQLDKSKAVVQAALDKTQQLFDSLMQQYFG